MDFFNSGEFMEYMGYRYTLVEDKIDECLEAIRAGELTLDDIDLDELEPDEIEYLKAEIAKRL